MKLHSISQTLKNAAICVLLSNFMVSAIAQTEEKLPNSVKVIANSLGYTVLKSFPAKGGLTGWSLNKGPGKNLIIYTPSDGSVAIAGQILDERGHNYNKDYEASYGISVDAKKAWNMLDKSGAYIKEGSSESGSYIYVFEDPNCGYCHYAWKALQPYVKAGLQVRWVPVAFLAPDSAEKNAYLMSASDKNEALKNMHEKWGSKNNTQIKTVVTANQTAMMDQNASLMRDLNFEGTPGIIYKDSKGNIIAAGGMPRLRDLPAITGMPEQVQTDKDVLAKFGGR